MKRLPGPYLKSGEDLDQELPLDPQFLIQGSAEDEERHHHHDNEVIQSKCVSVYISPAFVSTYRPMSANMPVDCSTVVRFVSSGGSGNVQWKACTSSRQFSR